MTKTLPTFAIVIDQEMHETDISVSEECTSTDAVAAAVICLSVALQMSRSCQCDYCMDASNKATKMLQAPGGLESLIEFATGRTSIH